MSKILYPVGTQVTLKKYPEAGVFEVIEYKKGEKFPYCLENEVGERGFAGKKRYSVKGLKRYNPKELRSADSVDISPTQAKATQTGSDVDSPKQNPVQDFYTREEVDGLIEHTIEYVLGQVNSIAFDLRNAILIGAETTDHNFGTVVKKFKTLNHDDD